MPGAFRDDLEAARSRAEALSEENEELREEVIRLRRGGGATPTVTDTEEGKPDPAENEELARLAEQTLEELDRINDHADASLPVGPVDPATAAEADPPAPQPEVRRHAAPPARRDERVDPVVLEPARAGRALVAPEVDSAELVELRAYRERERGRMVQVFVAGLAVGAALAAVLMR